MGSNLQCHILMHFGGNIPDSKHLLGCHQAVFSTANLMISRLASSADGLEHEGLARLAPCTSRNNPRFDEQFQVSVAAAICLNDLRFLRSARKWAVTCCKPWDLDNSRHIFCELLRWAMALANWFVIFCNDLVTRHTMVSNPHTDHPTNSMAYLSIP